MYRLFIIRYAFLGLTDITVKYCVIFQLLFFFLGVPVLALTDTRIELTTMCNIFYVLPSNTIILIFTNVRSTFIYPTYSQNIYNYNNLIQKPSIIIVIWVLYSVNNEKNQYCIWEFLFFFIFSI